MPRLSLTEKSKRLLQFLQALSFRRVSSAMAAVGFEQADSDEGWKLLREVRSPRFYKESAQVDPNVVRMIDAWENRWFPVADAALKRRFPEIHATLFLNLSQVEGFEAINTVDLLVERYDALAAKSDASSKEAIVILGKRGLTPAIIGEAKALLEKVAAVNTEPLPAPTPEEKAAEAQREAAMWAWYLEWTALARTVITDRRVLKQMGFLRSSGRGGAGEQDAGGDEDGDEDDGDVVPAPVG